MNLTYRKARAGDGPAIRALLGALGYDLPSGRAYEQIFAQVAAHPEFDVWVVAERTTLVGALTLSHRPQLRLAASVAAIDELVVAPSHRGQGVGTRLVELAIRRARELGCARVELQTRRDRESYQRGFYAAQGFTEVDSALFRLDIGRPATVAATKGFS